jgi:hypothetical protein
VEIMTKQCSMSRPLAPEDVRPGDYVCVLLRMEEYLPFWCLMESEAWKEPEPIRFQWLPEDGATPLRVIEVCVPFLLVEQVDGVHRTLDLRRHRLARVSERFGRRAFKRLRKRETKRSTSLED